MLIGLLACDQAMSSRGKQQEQTHQQKKSCPPPSPPPPPPPISLICTLLLTCLLTFSSSLSALGVDLTLIISASFGGLPWVAYRYCKTTAKKTMSAQHLPFREKQPTTAVAYDCLRTSVSYFTPAPTIPTKLNDSVHHEDRYMCSRLLTNIAEVNQAQRSLLSHSQHTFTIGGDLVVPAVVLSLARSLLPGGTLGAAAAGLAGAFAAAGLAAAGGFSACKGNIGRTKTNFNAHGRTLESQEGAGGRAG